MMMHSFSIIVILLQSLFNKQQHEIKNRFEICLLNSMVLLNCSQIFYPLVFLACWVSSTTFTSCPAVYEVVHQTENLLRQMA